MFGEKIPCSEATVLAVLRVLGRWLVFVIGVDPARWPNSNPPT